MDIEMAGIPVMSVLSVSVEFPQRENMALSGCLLSYGIGSRSFPVLPVLDRPGRIQLVLCLRTGLRPQSKQGFQYRPEGNSDIGPLLGYSFHARDHGDLDAAMLHRRLGSAAVAVSAAGTGCRTWPRDQHPAEG